MNNKTLVTMIFRTDCIGLRTVSRSHKSPHHFYILRYKLENLEHGAEIIVHDINSFAVLHRDAETVVIELTWLSGDGYNVSGYKETVILPYDKLVAHLHERTSEDNPVVWKTLSVDNSRKRPQLVFKSNKNLYNAIANGTIRRKLVRALCHEFNWPHSERIEFYDDFVPYSFSFREIRNGESAMNGGLILHGQENMQMAHYGIHT